VAKRRLTALQSLADLAKVTHGGDTIELSIL
jgi:hypothetical protein